VGPLVINCRHLIDSAESPHILSENGSQARQPAALFYVLCAVAAAYRCRNRSAGVSDAVCRRRIKP
jgi:hypothetical protein